jgi:shikimate dehydrogenase
MNPAGPALVVTLPARSAAVAREEVLRAREAGADYAEVRFDRWPPAERDRAASLFPSPLPLVATLRSRAEGGEGPDDPDERRAILSGLGRLPFAYLDLEAARDRTPRDISAATGTPPAGRTIRSTHLPAGSSLDLVLRTLQESVGPDEVRKVVVPLATGVAVTELLPTLASGPVAPNHVLLTTGGSGPLLRALGKRLRLPLVYAAPALDAASSEPSPVEEAQLPVDQLRRYFDASGEPPLFAVLGHPVRHSLSPRIHARWMAATGEVGLYFPLEIVSEEELRATLARLGPLGFRGLNVTHPWKAAALSLAARPSPAAAECGAANCLSFTGDGIVADNTDVAAARRRLSELRSQEKWGGDRLTVLGGGGAARATLAAARSLGARATVVARRRHVAEEAARTFGAEVGDPKHPVPAPLVVQATSAGHDVHHPLELPLPQLVQRGGYLLDWVYGGSDASAARDAHRAGAEYEGGERLLVYQAAASFEVWWGHPPPTPAVDAVLREVGCAG